MPSSSKTEEVEAKYDVALKYPNLELHSAAASGNVGLVHYALTHGQPVNSVLHGVLPLHAACSGGSVSVVRMLIERGADVNAPRLPRRYSDGRKSTAPSVGAAGSTPLHFAAANGHAPIVQILLTCGAVSDKPDKNGMTPEALAEINGHTEVIRVLRVWEHLKVQDIQSGQSSSPILPVVAASGTRPTELAKLGSASGSTTHLETPEGSEDRYGAIGARRIKERSLSFASNVSDTPSGRGISVKRSFQGLWRSREKRSMSGASAVSSTSLVSPISADDSETSPRPSGLSPGLHSQSPRSPVQSPEIEIASPHVVPAEQQAVEQPETTSTTEIMTSASSSDPQHEIDLEETVRIEDSGSAIANESPTTITQNEPLSQLAEPPRPTPFIQTNLAPPKPQSSLSIVTGSRSSPTPGGSRSSSPSFSAYGDDIQAALSMVTIGNEADIASPISPISSGLGDGRMLGAGASASSTSNHAPLDRVISGTSDTSSQPFSVISPVRQGSSPGRNPLLVGPPPVTRTASTNIASRRPSLPSIFEKAAHPGATFRAAMRRDQPRQPPDITPRSPTGETPPRTGSSSHSFFRGRHKSNEHMSHKQAAARRYMTKGALLQLFRRGTVSPPSRSPSPPRRGPSTSIPAEQIDEAIEKLRRASLDLERREGQSNIDEASEIKDHDQQSHPASAPATQTTFFLADSAAPPVPRVTPLRLNTSPNLGFGPREEQPLSAKSFMSERPWSRRRVGSEVIAPSPLANEFGHSSDSDSSPSHGFRRSKTEFFKAVTPSPRRMERSSPLATAFTKPRSSTLPGDVSRPEAMPARSRLVGLGWTRQKILPQAPVETPTWEHSRVDQDVETEDDQDDVFHDASPGGDEPQEYFAQSPRSFSDLADRNGNGTNGALPNEGPTEVQQQEPIEMLADSDETRAEPVESRAEVDSEAVQLIIDDMDLGLRSQEHPDEVQSTNTMQESAIAEDISRVSEYPWLEPPVVIAHEAVPTVTVEEITDPIDRDPTPPALRTHTNVEEAVSAESQSVPRAPSAESVEVDDGSEGSLDGDRTDGDRTPPALEINAQLLESALWTNHQSAEFYHLEPPELRPTDSEPRTPTTVSEELVTPTFPRPGPGPFGSRFIELSDSSKPFRGPMRYRGASVGSSNTTASSRLSSPPASLRIRTLSAESISPRTPPPPPPPSIISDLDSRPRGKSVSSMSSNTSGMAFSYMQTVSTPGTSLTPPSMLSIALGSGFPPVPEHEVADHRPQLSSRRTSVSVKSLSRAEARSLIKQNESSILQLAQLPLSANSSRDLAAQLAAYGENHALEQELAEEERERRTARLGSTSDQSQTQSEADNSSFYSASSGPSKHGSRMSLAAGYPRARRPSSKATSHDQPLFSSDSLVSATHPVSSVPNINSIYDRRASAYRERMAALAAVPPTPGSRAASRARSRPPTDAEARLGPNNESRSYAQSWLSSSGTRRESSDLPVEGEFIGHRNISSPMPIISSDLVPSRPAKKASSLRPHRHPKHPAPQKAASITAAAVTRSLSPMTSRLTSSSARPLSPLTAPPPIADVLSTRYQGMIVPPQASNPYISVFSSRFSGHPHDGGDSDDEEQQRTHYTVIENDRKGGQGVQGIQDAGLAREREPENLHRGGRWGNLRGAIGHLGRR